MNRLVIVGNGFDLALGNKTTVEDFLFHLLKVESRKLLLNGNLPNSFIERKSKSTQFSWLEIDKIDAYDNLGSISIGLIEKEFNVVSDLLRSILAIGSSRKWYDIENVYFEILMNCLKSPKSQKDIKDGVIKLNEELSAIVSELKSYLIDVEKSFVIEEHTDDIKYIDYQLKNNLNKVINETDKGSILLFVNFNYTKLLSLALMPLYAGVNQKIIHIHGNLVDTSGVQPVLMGYGDDLTSEFQIIKDSGIYEAMLYIKPNHFSKNENFSEILSYCDSQNFEVFVVGHSLGMTDHHILSTIFEHQNCKSISLFHKGSREDFMKRSIALSNHLTDRRNLQRKIRPFDIDQRLKLKIE